jgi:hypothetical protein
VNPWLIILDALGWIVLGGLALTVLFVLFGLAIGVKQAIARGKSKSKTTVLIGRD